MYAYNPSSSRSKNSFSINRSIFRLIPLTSNVPLFLVAVIVSATNSAWLMRFLAFKMRTIAAWVS